MIHEEKQTERIKSISGVTEVLGWRDGEERGRGNKQRNHPLTVMHPFELQHTRTRTPIEAVGNENYYFDDSFGGKKRVI